MLLRLDTPIRKVSWNALTRGVAARLRESGDVSKRSGGEWECFCFNAKPGVQCSKDPRSGRIQRHHVDEATIQKAIRAAVVRRGLAKRASSHTFRHSFATHALQRGLTSGRFRNCSG